MSATAGSGSASMRPYVIVWLGLLLIVAVEVGLTYAGLSTGSLLAALLALAIIEAAIGLMYFMHLRFERRLLWTLVPGLIFVFLFMNHIWPDAFRLFHMRVNAP